MTPSEGERSTRSDAPRANRPQLRSWRQRSALFMLSAIGGLLCLGLVAIIASHMASRSPSGAANADVALRDVFGIETPIALSATPSLWLDRGRLTLDRSAPTVAASKGADGTLRAAKRLLLEQPEFRLSSPIPDVLVVDTRVPTFGPDSVSPLLSQLAGLGFDGLRIERGSLRFGDASDALTDINATLARDDAGGLIAQGQGRYRGLGVRFDVQAAALTATAVAGPAAAARPAERAVTLRMDVDGIGRFTWETRLREALGTGIDGRLNARTANPFAMATWLGFPIRPLSGFRDLTLTADLIWQPGHPLRLTVTDLQFDRQKPATGALMLTAVGQRPRIEGTLAFATLDLSRYARAMPASATGTPATWQQLPLIADGLQDLDLDVRLSAGAVQIGAHNLGRTAASIVAQGGTLSLDVADANWNGHRGNIRVSTEAMAGGARVGLRGRIESTDSAPLANAVLGANAIPGDRLLIDGPTTTTFDLKGTGATVISELGRTLNGRVTIVGGARGSRLWLDPQRMAQAVDAQSRGKSSAPASLAASGSMTPLDDLELRLQLDPQAVVIERANLRTKSTGVQLTGRIDRLTGELDALGEIQLGADLKDRSTRRPDLAAPRLLFSLSGPWASPELAARDAKAAKP